MRRGLEKRNEVAPSLLVVTMSIKHRREMASVRGICKLGPRREKSSVTLSRDSRYQVSGHRQRYREADSMTGNVKIGQIVIAGGSGFLGITLATHLAASGKSILLLSRHPPKTRS